MNRLPYIAPEQRDSYNAPTVDVNGGEPAGEPETAVPVVKKPTAKKATAKPVAKKAPTRKK